MIHVTLPQLCAYLDGELAESSAELVRRHLSECLECIERFAKLEAQDEILIRILADDPQEEFFQCLSASIPLGQPASAERPAPAEREKPVPSHAGRRAEDKRRNRLGPRTAWIAAGIAAAICCVVAGSAAWVAFRPAEPEPVVPPMVVERQNAAAETTPPVEMEPLREQPPEPLAEPHSEQPSEPMAEPQHDPTEAPPQETASASEPAPAPTPAQPSELPPVAATPNGARARGDKAPAPKGEATKKPKPEHHAERAAQNVVPVRTVITETIVEPEAQHAAPVPVPVPPGAPLPSTPSDPVALALRDAKSASLEAAQSKLPASFDKSAEAWERALPLLENSPEALAGGRRELAQARFQAWAAEPTPARREAAIASARQYLLYAPPGPDRDQAWTWLGRLKH